MIRVLGGPGDAATHLENRVGEPAANPYLYMASQIASGLDGLDRSLDPGRSADTPYESDAPLLPRSPYVNARGQMTDGAAHARWIAEQNNGLHQAPAMPCRNPRDRGSFSASQYCICGHAMSVHVGGH